MSNIIPDYRRFVRGVAFATGLLAVTVLGACSDDSGTTVAQGKLPETAHDMALGDPAAPVQLVEYASMTCGHCAAFHEDVFPKIKAAFIDTGKLRFILRAYPLDPFATAAIMAAHCNGKDYFFETVGVILARQDRWLAPVQTGEQRTELLGEVLREANMGREAFYACLRDDALRQRIDQEHNDGESKYGIESTPSFIINGKKFSGELSFVRFESILTEALNEAAAVEASSEVSSGN